jgi:hypothetical protein
MSRHRSVLVVKVALGLLAILLTSAGCGLLSAGATFDLPGPASAGMGCRGVGLRDTTVTGSIDDPHLAWLVQSGQRLDVVWAAGLRARFDPRLEIIDEIGTVRLRDGDPVTGACTARDGLMVDADHQ